MKTTYKIIALIFFLTGLLSCKKDLAVATKGNAQIALTVTLPTASGTSLTLTKEDSALVILQTEWSKPQYLADSALGNIAMRYVLQIDISNAFAKPYQIDFAAKRDSSFNVYHLNAILNQLECTPGIANPIFIRVNCISSVDTISSNIYSFSAVPYSLIVPPKITVPNALVITGAAIPGGWITPFPENQRFTKINTTTYTLTTELLGGKQYELITDINGNSWTPVYHIAPTDDPSALIHGGAFIEDGDGTVYNWSGKQFVTPPDNGSYKLTFNFQTATFTVEKQ